MANERLTENLVLKEMGIDSGELNHEFGIVHWQGDCNVQDIDEVLKKMGGKPKIQELLDMEVTTKGKAKPEFIIQLLDDSETIIVVECKKDTKKHMSEHLNQPMAYAVDGALYYAKHLKEYYNVIAIAVSGTKIEEMKANTYHWKKNSIKYEEMESLMDLIVNPTQYLKILNGEAVKKGYSLSTVRALASMMHNTLRSVKMTEKNKPIFIAGILMALQDENFVKSYKSQPNFDMLINSIKYHINQVLTQGNISRERIDYISNAFTSISTNDKLRNKPHIEDGSLMWYVKELERKIRPMMTADVMIDALGEFYHEFVKYSGGDGSGLGIVLTPSHITNFMCELVKVNKNTKVVDICCGSGSFLVSAISKMFSEATNDEEIQRIRKENIYGVELDQDLHTLALANMIVKKDGKSNIIYGDCFDKKIFDSLKEKNIDIALINPPYSQDDLCELEFIEQALKVIKPGGMCAAIVPQSCAIGTKYKEVRERMFKNHTLKAVFSMPDDLFYPTATNTCIMIWKSQEKHDSDESTFFGYFKDDGFEKRKNIGRTDVNNKWKLIKDKWLKAYKNRDVIDGLTAKANITHSDEWLCEAYMHTDYSVLTSQDFENNVRNFYSFMLKEK